jgi:DnaK suppressor protein
MRAIKRDLEGKRKALVSAISSTMGSARDTEHGRDLLKDPFGSASTTHDDEVAAVMVDRAARELQEVDRALEDIEAGRYGICRDCEGPIGAARLKAVPFATRCVRCQETQERTLRPAA